MTDLNVVIKISSGRVVDNYRLKKSAISCDFLLLFHYFEPRYYVVFQWSFFYLNQRRLHNDQRPHRQLIKRPRLSVIRKPLHNTRLLSFAFRAYADLSTFNEAFSERKTTKKRSGREREKEKNSISSTAEWIKRSDVVPSSVSALRRDKARFTR